MSDESDRQSRHDGDDGTSGIEPDPDPGSDRSDSSADGPLETEDRPWESGETAPVPDPGLDPDVDTDTDAPSDDGGDAGSGSETAGTDDPDTDAGGDPGGGAPEPVSSRAEGIGAGVAAGPTVPADAETAGSEVGTGTETGTGTGTEPGAGPPGVGDPFVDEEPPKPPDDEEKPLAEHIEEMIKRLAVVVIAVALATAVSFPFAAPVINVMWYGLLPVSTPPPHLYGPLEKLLTEIKVASLAGVLVALPVLVYEAYLFMRPGLYPRERRYFLSAVPTSLILGAIGMAFSYFLVLPVLFQYFVVYSESGVDKLAFGLQVTFDLIVALLSAFALVFQIPLLVMLAIMMGVTTRGWLEDRRLYFWAGFLGLGFLLGGADLTGMAPIVIAATMIGLFEGTLALLRWTSSG